MLVKINDLLPIAMLSNQYSKLIIAVVMAFALSSCIATKSYKKPDVETENLYPFEQVEIGQFYAGRDALARSF